VSTRKRSQREQALDAAVTAFFGAWRYYATFIAAHGGTPTPRMARALYLLKEAMGMR
jgi:hypothetical protein